MRCVRTFSRSPRLDVYASIQVALLWPAKFSHMTVIFLVNKYSPILDTSIGIIRASWGYICRVEWVLIKLLVDHYTIDPQVRRSNKDCNWHSPLF